jgi:hypothetical protein
MHLSRVYFEISKWPILFIIIAPTVMSPLCHTAIDSRGAASFSSAEQGRITDSILALISCHRSILGRFSLMNFTPINYELLIMLPAIKHSLKKMHRAASRRPIGHFGHQQQLYASAY